MDKLFQLIEGCAQQNRAYQKLFYEQYHEHCLKTAYRYVDSFEQAVELTHFGFLRIFRKFGDLSIPDKDKAEDCLLKWISEMIIGVVVDNLKPELSKGIVSEGRSAIIGKPAAILGDPVIPDTRSMSEDLVFHSELITLVRELPPAYRMIFNLHIIDGYSHCEIARMLGISAKTSATYLKKARSDCYRSFLLYLKE